MLDFAIAVAWYNPEQRAQFLAAWGIEDRAIPPWLILQQDTQRAGGSKTKNLAIHRAIDAGAQHIIVLDDDCFPADDPLRPYADFEGFAAQHIAALDPQPVALVEAITDPPSRGTPYAARSATMPVAASMGYWTEIGDYCAPRQLAFGATHPMTFERRTIFGRYFSLCGMNYAFRPEWEPWCYLVEDVGRFDDIWMGWLWQRAAYERGHCFSLTGPLVRHSRQSNVWANLRDEARFLEINETLWRTIMQAPIADFGSLRALLPTIDGRR